MPTAVTFNPVFPRVRYSRGAAFSAPAKEGKFGKRGDAAAPRRAEDILFKNCLRSIFSESMRILLFLLKCASIITFLGMVFNEGVKGGIQTFSGVLTPDLGAT